VATRASRHLQKTVILEPLPRMRTRVSRLTQRYINDLLRLYRYTDTVTGSVFWRHPSATSRTDHEVIAVPVLETFSEKIVRVCDFCSEHVNAGGGEFFETTTKTTEAFRGKGTVVQMADDGRWFACDPCTGFVRGGDRAGLLRRSVRISVIRDGSDVLAAREGLGFAHEMFWAAYPQ
jgi:hypothetical protein